MGIVDMKNCTSVAMIVALTFAACSLNPNYEDITDPSKSVRLVLDSNEARQLISRQDAFTPEERKEIDLYNRDIIAVAQELDREQTKEATHRYNEMKKNAARYIPERTAFLYAMARVPAVLVEPNSYCRVLQRSQAKCTNDPESNCEFVKVRVTSGPSRGREGWGCDGDGIYRAWAMP